AGLDPTDVSAFVTTLTFMGDGRFTGSMRALVAEVSEPGTMALFGAAVLAMGLRRKQIGR
ncbi:MAG: PEP-CTERM sorting domain-containing protein, partial [Gammaproteobacteria bacterium]